MAAMEMIEEMSGYQEQPAQLIQYVYPLSVQLIQYVYPSPA